MGAAFAERWAAMIVPEAEPTADDLRARTSIIDALSSSLDRVAQGLSSVPGLLHQVLAGEKWRHFVTLRDEEVRHENFMDFIRTPPLKGLGATEDLIRRIVANDLATLELLDQALQPARGCPARGIALTVSPCLRDEPTAETSSKFNKQPPVQTRTTRDAGLRKLRQHAPEYVLRVESGEMSVNGALIQAGLRQRTISVPVSTPDAIARALRKNLSKADLAQLVEILASGT